MVVLSDELVSELAEALDLSESLLEALPLEAEELDASELANALSEDGRFALPWLGSTGVEMNSGTT